MLKELKTFAHDKIAPTRSVQTAPPWRPLLARQIFAKMYNLSVDSIVQMNRGISGERLESDSYCDSMVYIDKFIEMFSKDRYFYRIF